MRPAGAIARLSAGLLVLLAVAAGCGKTPGEPPANVAPTTTLFLDIPNLTGSPDSHKVAYRQPMHWWGSDVDGKVMGYEWRIISQSLGGVDFDSTAWSYTTRTDSTFDFPATEPRVRRAFEVRAVDDHGLHDPTPSRQDLYLANDPPTVSIKRSQVPASTLPALTLTWSGRDPQGNNTIDRYRLWAKGTPEAGAIVVHAPDSSGTFGQAMLGITGGSRTLYVRAVDRGGMAGLPDSVTVNILARNGSVLVVDDCPSDTPPILRSFYPDQVAAAVGANRSTLMRISDLGAVRSAVEADSLLAQFSHVVYFREANKTLTSTSISLKYMGRGIQSLLARGGGAYLSGPVVVGTDSSLSCGVTGTPDEQKVFPASGFAKQVLGIGAFHVHVKRDARVTYDSNFDLGRDGSDPTGATYAPFTGNPDPAIATHDMETGFNAGSHNPPLVFSAEAFEPDSAAAAGGTVKVLWQIPPHTVDGQDILDVQATPYPVAVLSSQLGGKIAYLSYSLRLLNFRGNATTEFQRVLDLIGIPRP